MAFSDSGSLSHRLHNASLVRRLRVKFPGRKQCQAAESAPETHQQQQISCSSPPLPFPDGVEVLHDCPDAILDICFVHGLSGNRIGTWTAKGQSKPWPEALLPTKLSRARILTYGYDAYIVGKPAATENGIMDHGLNLLNDLVTERASASSDASSRPLVFVAHSLGGLVCKEAILLSRNNPEPHLRGIFDCIKGIIFLGTPHRGSWLADWARIPASALWVIKSTNKSLLQILETDHKYLQSIQTRFWSMVREQQNTGRELEVTCFFEELPLSGIGKIVSKDSATLESYNAVSVHANHSNMVKFSSVDDNGFKRLLGELTRWELQIENSVTREPRRPVNNVRPEMSFNSYFSNYGSGGQFITSAGTQNICNASGNQFPGATFYGSMQFS
ncbi:hypothetical protein NM208_g3855 [Fusarium decemcellulare]|uniref:Uncharacterized protein n=1 Tax=Fusarium decemcellulare TaxID=57161 RepID=A0ACC1SMJ0_9HYPO|nr:hypothetical protein NM208_g3855 [Fusarium decemcellulare]